MRTISMIFIFFSFFVAIQLSSVTSLKQNYDFLLFVQQWPGAVCSGKGGCCYPGEPPSAFEIHGLWPQFNNGSYPQKCDPKKENPFNLTQINGLISSLEKEWPSLSCPKGNSTELWEHEWVKHGTCSLPTLNQHAYFDAALKLKQKMNLLQILKGANIEPNGSSYTKGDILEALANGSDEGFTPGIECNQVQEKNNKTVTQLYQVKFCVNKSGTKFIYCPQAAQPKIECGNANMIKFPIVGRSQLKIGQPA